MISDPFHVYGLFATLMFCCFIMFLEYWAVLVIQGRKGLKAGTRLAEDTKDGGKSHTEADIEADDRWRRIVRNHTETVPLAFVVFFICTLVTEYEPNTFLAILIVIVIYTFSRILWTFCYAWGIQPLRSICWLVANLCVFTAGIAAVIDAFRALQFLKDANASNP